MLKLLNVATKLNEIFQKKEKTFGNGTFLLFWKKFPLKRHMHYVR